MPSMCPPMSEKIYELIQEVADLKARIVELEEKQK